LISSIFGTKQLKIDVMDSVGTAVLEEDIFIIEDTNVTDWVQVSVDLSAYINQGAMRLRFSVLESKDDRGEHDVAIDDVQIADASPSASGDIQGTVFRDYNSDGVRLSADGGVANITVTAYDAAGAAVATTTTDSDGNYMLSGLTDGTPYRIEFTGLPSYLEPGVMGIDSTTSVTFATSPATGINLGLHNPSEYCQNDPDLVTSCYVNGDPLGGGTAGNLDALISFPYSASSTWVDPIVVSTPAAPDHDATAAQIGATWGLAFQRSTQTLFAGAILKRHVGFGDVTGDSIGDPGGIWAVDYTNPISPTVTKWLDVNSLAGVNVGTIDRTDLGNTSSSGSRDVAAFDAVGKISLGDLDISADGQTLYVMNLNGPELLAIDIATKSLVGKYAISNADVGCTNSYPSTTLAYNLGTQNSFGSYGGFVNKDSIVTVGDFEDFSQSTRQVNTTSAIAEIFGSHVKGDSATNNIEIDIPLADGSYDVTLYFSSDRRDSSGEMVADVFLEGTQVLNDYDPSAATGGPDQTDEYTFSVTVVGGNLDLEINDVSSALEPTIHGIKIVTSTNTPTAAPNDIRPWAVKVYNDEVYIGVVCSAETSGHHDDLSAHVLKFNGTTFDTILDYGLDYNRGTAYNSIDLDEGFANNPGNNPEDIDHDPAITVTVGTTATVVGGHFYGTNIRGWYGNGKYTLQHPQPMLADLEFDADGNLIMQFMDRFGHQGGYPNSSPTSGEDYPAANSQYYFQSSGDLLRACLVSGSYVLEGDAGCAEQSHQDVYGGGQGFFDDTFILSDFNKFDSVHENISAGGLARLGSTADIVGIVVDPLETNSAGLQWWNVDSGTVVQDYHILGPADGSRAALGEDNSFFNKANGLGDLELICEPAPLEIGNYVWRDTDGDGIQDPDEPAITGAVVTLHDMDNSGTQVGTATTDANGLYYFGGLNDTNMTSGELLINRNYEVRISLSDAALPANLVTIQNANGIATNDNQTDLADNDAISIGGNAVIAFATGNPGENNHTLDFGFNDIPPANPALALEKILNTPEPVSAGASLSFTIRITNTGDAIVTTLPLTDTYDVTYLSYDSLNGSMPATDNNTDDGYLDWSDLTATEGDLAPGGVIEVVVYFTALKDSSGLAAQSPCVNAGESCNVAAINNAMAGAQPVPPVEGSDDVAIEEVISGKSSLGDFVWYDADSDGNKDPEEWGINGVILNLYEDLNTNGMIDAGEFVTATTTASSTISSDSGISIDGHYKFDIYADTIYIVEVDPANYAPGGALEDYFYTGDNASNPYNGPETRVVPVGTGPVDIVDVDFSYVTHSLGNYVWFDSNNSGDVTAGELPVPDGVTIELLDSNGTVTATTTITNGYYIFTGLPAGDYQVRIPAANFQPAGLLDGYTHSTGPAQEADPNSDGDQNDNGLDGSDPVVDGITSAVVTIGGTTPTLASGGPEPTSETPAESGTAGDDGAGTPDINSNLTVDFGIVPESVLIGNRVWIENDNDGLANTGTITPVVGIIVTAVSSDGTVYTDTTDANGYYTITVLPDDVYTVTVGTPASTIVAIPVGGLVGSDNDPTSDDDKSHDPAGTVVTVGEDDNLTIDFGFYETFEAFELSKVTNTPSPVRLDETISFTIRITNTGTAILTSVPLVDRYNAAFFTYVSASPGPDTPISGELTWNDLTATE